MWPFGAWIGKVQFVPLGHAHWPLCAAGDGRVWHPPWPILQQEGSVLTMRRPCGAPSCYVRAHKAVPPDREKCRCSSGRRSGHVMPTARVQKKKSTFSGTARIMQIETRYNRCALARHNEPETTGLCIDDVCRAHCAEDRICRLSCTAYVAAASSNGQRLLPPNGQSVQDFTSCLAGLESSHVQMCSARACGFSCDDDGTTTECGRACATWLNNEPRSRAAIDSARTATGSVLPMFRSTQPQTSRGC